MQKIKDWDISSVFNGSLDDLPGDYYGFIYKITNIDNGKIYIGRKNFYTKRKRKFGKKEIAALTDRRSKKWEYVEKESNWRDYLSSCTPLKEDIKNGANIYREIIKLVDTKRAMTYYETKYQFLYKVIEDDTYNGSILGRFYKNIFEE